MSATRPPRISWNWNEALRGVVCCLPAAGILLATNIELGIACAIGALPVALMGVTPSRKQRLQALLLGTTFAVVFFLGAAVSQLPLVAVVSLFGVSHGAAVLANKRLIGRIVVGLVLPALAVGLSSDSIFHSYCAGAP